MFAVCVSIPPPPVQEPFTNQFRSFKQLPRPPFSICAVASSPLPPLLCFVWVSYVPTSRNTKKKTKDDDKNAMRKERNKINLTKGMFEMKGKSSG